MTHYSAKVNSVEETDVFANNRRDHAPNILRAGDTLRENAHMCLQILMASNEDNSHYQYFLGKTSNPETDIVKIDGLDSDFTYQVSNSAENHDTFTMDMGETLGKADVKRCTIQDMIAGIREIDKEGNIIQ